MFNFKFDIKRFFYKGNFINYAFVPWDSKYLNIRISTIIRLGYKKEKDFIKIYKKFEKWDKKNSINLCYVRVPVDKTEIINYLENKGFEFREVNIRPFFNLKEKRIKKLKKGGFFVRKAGTKDFPKIIKIAASAFSKRRYHSDLRFSEELTNFRYKKWVENCLRERQQAFIIEDKKQIVGFSIFKIEGIVANLQLYAVKKEFQGKGLGKALLSQSMGFLKKNGICKITSNFSRNNTPSFYVFKSLDYNFRQPQVVLHKWFKSKVNSKLQKRKKILILGAGVYQVPLILKAQEMEIETIVASREGTYPGFALADYVEKVDTTDIAGILKIAKKYKVNAVATAGTDVAIPALGKVNDNLGLIGCSFHGALNSSDKVLMKEAFKQNNIRSAQFFRVKSLKKAQEAVRKVGLPAMVKAPNSSGGRGITKINSFKQLEFAWKRAQEFTKGPEILIEEYLDGIEFGVQTFIYKNKVLFVLPHNDVVTPPPFLTPIGHSFPMKLTGKQKEETEEIVEKSMLALGLDNCAGNIDLLMAGGKPYVLEIGARSGATCLPEMVEASYGIDFYKLIIDVAMGKKPNFSLPRRVKPSAAFLLRSKKDGIVEELHIPNSLKNHKNIFKVSFDIHVGDRVNKFIVGPDRIGEIIARGDTLRKVERFVQQAEKQLIIEIR